MGLLISAGTLASLTFPSPIAKSSVLPGMVVSVWIRNPPSTSVAVSLRSFYTIQAIGVDINRNAAALIGQIDNSSASVALSSTSAAVPAANTWCHIMFQVGTNTSNQSRLYVNGNQSATAVTGGPVDTNGAFDYIRIGQRFNGQYTFTSGNIAEVAIWGSIGSMTVATLASDLAAGRNPMQQSVLPSYYWPLRSDLTGYGTLATDLNPTGSLSYPSHPLVDPVSAVTYPAHGFLPFFA